MQPKAILFDLDNTLVDRAASLKEYAFRFFVDFRDRLQEGSAQTVFNVITSVDAGGYGGWEKIIATLLSDLTWQSTPNQDELAAHRFENYALSAKPMPGLHQTLHRLQENFTLGIITNGTVHAQQGKIDQLELDRYMQSIVISGSERIKKPDPRIFEIALTRMSLSAEDAWFIGDHPRNDVIGAAQASLIPVWRRGFHPWPSEYAEPEKQIDSLTDLFPLLNLR
ncbi:MAG: HAD family hydrolase [Chloroflexota bacterium]